MMNAQLIRNVFGYKEFCIKADQNPKRSLFMLQYQESFFFEAEIQVSSTLGIVHSSDDSVSRVAGGFFPS